MLFTGYYLLFKYVCSCKKLIYYYVSILIFVKSTYIESGVIKLKIHSSLRHDFLLKFMHLRKIELKI